MNSIPTLKPSCCSRSLRVCAPMALTVALAGCFTSAPSDAADLRHQQGYTAYPGEVGGRSASVTVSVPVQAATLRTYTLNSTAEQREQAPSARVVTEDAMRPRVRSGSLQFDALYAMAIDDAKLDSVSQIRDGSYNGGDAIDCDCFQTGEKWSYVWTRDLSYAVNLGLAGFDAPRAVNSMLFKTSALRDGVRPPASLPVVTAQIVQDTGSGGSWPVSSDRVTWAFGAESLLNQLDGKARSAFADKAYAALRGTVEADRQAVYDPKAGLYGGEQSYLDWRTQTYAPWIVNNLSRMAGSKALSTNVAHYQALRVVGRLAAERGETALAAKYAGWAGQLKVAINETFWLPDVQRYASLTGADEDPAPVHKFDMLGTALVVLSGIAPEDRAREALARYPHAPFGVPVYTPQQPDVPVYHNRSIWPFVTAYALRAAAQVGNPKVAANAIDSLMRGAALNLSNMENLEWLTGKAFHDDGPVVNSRRQLWSVGGYLSLVQEAVFGYRVVADGLDIRPFLTLNARKALGQGGNATLQNLNYRGKRVDVRLQLPAAAQGDGYYALASVKLNGVKVNGVIRSAQLKATNVIEVSFGPVQAGDARITMTPQSDPNSHVDPAVYSPEAPTALSVTPSGKGVAVVFKDMKNAAIGRPLSYAIYRDGTRVREGMRDLAWTDPAPAATDRRVCYAAEAIFDDNGHRSHHSEPMCVEARAVQVIAVSDARIRSNLPVTSAGDGIAEPTLRDWGAPADALAVSSLDIEVAGVYGIELVYNNHQQDISTGVTNAVKLLRVLDASGAEIGRGVVQMPNIESRGGSHPLRTSTMLRFALPAGRLQLELGEYFNMSYLGSNATYNGSGGRGGPVNRASIASFRIVPLGE